MDAWSQVQGGVGESIFGAMRSGCLALCPKGCTGFGGPGRLATRAIFAPLTDSGWVRAEATSSPSDSLGSGRRSVARTQPGDLDRPEVRRAGPDGALRTGSCAWATWAQSYAIRLHRATASWPETNPGPFRPTYRCEDPRMVSTSSVARSGSNGSFDMSLQ
jgi:hypothetical protein